MKCELGIPCFSQCWRAFPWLHVRCFILSPLMARSALWSIKSVGALGSDSERDVWWWMESSLASRHSLLFPLLRASWIAQQRSETTLVPSCTLAQLYKQLGFVFLFLSASHKLVLPGTQPPPASPVTFCSSSWKRSYLGLWVLYLGT